MTGRARAESGAWAIVVADDHGFESGLSQSGDGRAPPIQYCALRNRRTLFQDALRRAMRVAAPSRLIVTTLESDRCRWEPQLWFVPPEHRLVSTESGMSWLATASAILSIASQAPDSVVVLLPARCFVSHEAILHEALSGAISLLPLVRESVISLGMQDLEGGIDEDYLVPRHGSGQYLQPLLGVARRPVPWTAHYLRSRGALVASRILCARARALATHVASAWPGLASRLLDQCREAAGKCAPGGVPVKIPQGMPRALLRSRQWYPPSLPQRALRVRACGWSGLCTARAVARASVFLHPTQETPLLRMPPRRVQPMEQRRFP